MALQIYRPLEDVFPESISSQANITASLMTNPSQMITVPESALFSEVMSTSTASSTSSVELIIENENADTSFTLPDTRDTGVEPALSLSQLVIMALVQAPDRTLSTKEIYKWINDSFKYYRDLALDHNLSGSPDICPWLESVDDILHEFDFPTIPVYTDDVGQRFHLPLGGEWFILTSSFEKGATKPFPLLDLPLELRLMIYAWTLRRTLSPKYGWVIDPDYTMNKIEDYRKLNRKSVFLSTTLEGGWQLRTPRMDKVLALLSVNTQVSRESMPVFYRHNYFSFESLKILRRFLRGIPSRLEFVRNIVLNYDPSSSGHEGGAACKMLVKTKVRNMVISIDEAAVLKEHGFRNTHCDVRKLPGFEYLAKNLRGLDSVIFLGRCDKTKVLLKTLVDEKKDDSLDTDEKIEKKMEKDGKMRLELLKRARNNMIKRRKQEELAERKAQGDKVRLESKIFREEQKKAKSAAKSKGEQLLQQQISELKPSTPRRKANNYEADVAKIKRIKAEAKKRRQEQAYTPLQSSEDETGSEWENLPRETKRAKTTRQVLAVKVKTVNKSQNGGIFSAQPTPKPNVTKSCTGNARKRLGAAKSIVKSPSVVIDLGDDDMSDAFEAANEKTN